MLVILAAALFFLLFLLLLRLPLRLLARDSSHLSLNVSFICARALCWANNEARERK